MDKTEMMEKMARKEIQALTVRPLPTLPWRALKLQKRRPLLPLRLQLQLLLQPLRQQSQRLKPSE